MPSLHHGLNVVHEILLPDVSQPNGVDALVVAEVPLQCAAGCALRIRDLLSQRGNVLLGCEGHLLFFRIVHLLDACEKLVLGLDRLGLEYFEEAVSDDAANLVLGLSEQGGVAFPGGGDLEVEAVDALLQFGQHVVVRLLVLDLVAYHADVVEAPGQHEVHELQHQPVLQVQQPLPLYNLKDLMVDEFSFELFEMGLFGPFVEFVVVSPGLLHLLVDLELGEPDEHVLHVVVGLGGQLEVVVVAAVRIFEVVVELDGGLPQIAVQPELVGEGGVLLAEYLVVQQVAPAQPLGLVDADDFPQEAGDLFRRPAPVELELLTVQDLLRLDLVVHLDRVGRSVGHFAEHHLEEDYPQRPDVSLPNRKPTFSPYGYFFITSGAIVVMVPSVVRLTSSSSTCLEKPKSAIL